MPSEIYQDPRGTYRNTYTPGPDPRQNEVAPDWNAEHESFRNTLIQRKFGGRSPYDSPSPEDVVRRWDSTQSGRHFDNFFAGRISSRDKGRMNSKMRSAWNKEVARKHADILERTKAENDRNIKNYDKMMTEFGKEQIAKKAQWDAQVKAAEAKKTKESAAKKAKGTQIKNVHDFEKGILRDIIIPGPEEDGKGRYWAEGDRIPPKELKKMNRYRETQGSPRLVENKQDGQYGYDIKQPEIMPSYGKKKEYREAPPKALQILRDNPDSIDQFIRRFGYRPEGY